MIQTTQQPVANVAKTPQKRPDETGTIVVQGFIKIFDPNTQEKFVEKRA